MYQITLVLISLFSIRLLFIYLLKQERERERENLATKGTESESVGEATSADFTSKGNALAGSGLRALIEKHNLGAVDYVCLDA